MLRTVFDHAFPQGADGADLLGAYLACGMVLLALVSLATATRDRLFGVRVVLVLASTAGVLWSAVADSFVGILLSLELAALPATAALLLDASKPADRGTMTRSLATGLAATLLLAFGLTTLAVASGAHRLGSWRVANGGASAAAFLAADSRIIAIGLVPVIAALALRLAMLPFQWATIEIVERAKPWALGLWATQPRAAAMILLVRLTTAGRPGTDALVRTTLLSVALLATAVGAIMLVRQTRLRQVFAYAINLQGGFLLAALVVASWERLHAVTRLPALNVVPSVAGTIGFAFVIDCAALLGLALLMNGRHSEGTGENRVTVAASCVLVLSLAGLPLTAGFWSKIWLTRSMLSIGMEPEAGFLPHQNVSFVLFAAVMAGGWSALGISGLRWCETLGEEGFGDRRRRGPLSLSQFAGAAIAALMIAIGMAPGVVARRFDVALAQVARDTTGPGVTQGDVMPSDPIESRVTENKDARPIHSARPAAP